MNAISESRLKCVRCGYGLTGVAIGGVCPECGEPIETSITEQTGPKTTPGLAIASLVLGIVCVPMGMCGILSAPFAILAVVFGHVARYQIAARPEVHTGRGLALAGLALGYVCLGLVAVSMLWLIAY